MSFARKIGEHLSKHVSNKYSQKLSDHAKQSATDVFKIVSKRAIQKPAGTIGDTTGNKISDKIARVSKTSLQNNLVTNEE